MSLRNSAACVCNLVAVIFAVNTIAYASVANSLSRSVTLPSAGVVIYNSTSTIVVRVSASHDDAGAYFHSGIGQHIPWSLDASQVSVGNVGTDVYNGGLRFVNVNIPQGAKIVSAVLKVCSDMTCEGTGARWDIYGENVSNSVEFSTKEEFQARPKTVAKVDTGFFSKWVEGTWYEISDMAPVIQEIVSRSDWSSGNALALLLFGHAEATTTHEIRSYDANPSQAALLEVTYETN